MHGSFRNFMPCRSVKLNGRAISTQVLVHSSMEGIPGMPGQRRKILTLSYIRYDVADGFDLAGCLETQNEFSFCV